MLTEFCWAYNPFRILSRIFTLLFYTSESLIGMCLINFSTSSNELSSLLFTYSLVKPLNPRSNYSLLPSVYPWGSSSWSTLVPTQTLYLQISTSFEWHVPSRGYNRTLAFSSLIFYIGSILSFSRALIREKSVCHQVFESPAFAYSYSSCDRSSSVEQTILIKFPSSPSRRYSDSIYLKMCEK
jgi:hypothetical protein